jgi:hypothetical protein
MKLSVIERSSSFEDALWMALKAAIADRQPLSDREFANLSAESDARRTGIPTEGGQQSDDCGQRVRAA